MMSESNKQQAVNKLTEIVANFTAMISTRMPDDVVDKLKQLKDAETSSMGKIIYHTMFDNMQKAIDLNRPACQDTGEIMFFVKVGSRFPLLGELQSILKQAVEEATVKAPLRHNAVEIFDEVNTGKNTGSGVPWVTWDIIPDNDDAEIEVYMAGGGCTLPGRSKVLMPSEGYEGVVKFVFENSSTLAVNACPPVLVGVGIATSVEDKSVTYAIRPEKLLVTTEMPTCEHNWSSGKVHDIAYLGGHSVFYVELPSGKLVQSFVANAERRGQRPTWGDQVYVWWEDDSGVVLRS